MLLKSILLGIVLLCSMGAGPCWLKNQYVVQPPVVYQSVYVPYYAAPQPVVVVPSVQYVYMPVNIPVIEYRIINTQQYYAVPVASPVVYNSWIGYKY